MLGTSIIVNKKPPGPPVKLSLVALMDIFTILVFFLLLNSGDSQTLEDAKFVTLPNSTSETSPHSDLVIHVGMDELWMDNQKILDLKDIVADLDKPILPLSQVLESHASKLGDFNEHEKENGLSITIMADKSVPYGILKSVMSTCSGQNFRDISLAVNQVAAQAFVPGADAPAAGNAAQAPGAELPVPASSATATKPAMLNAGGQ